MLPRFHRSILVLISTLALCSWASGTVGISVALDYGTFNGFANISTGIIYFRGVRFADPPVGDLRWRAPVSPPTKHLGNVSSTKFGSKCISTTQTTVSTSTSEDCLFGNVYIPINTLVNDLLPVMVWFHGGGYQAGDTHDAPPELIMQSSSEPLIFVSFEYRLGQFGFLGGSEINKNGSLNAGLLDQRAALQWVQTYIQQFGGDKSRVTIWGQSAGSGSTMIHLTANGGKNQNLFRAAMGDSPPLTYMPLFDQPYAEEIFIQFANLAGCTNTSTSLSCLRSASSEEVTLAGSQLLAARPSTLYVFAPILDGTFIRKRPVEAFESGEFIRVPILFGSNTNEGAGWSANLPNPNANTSMPNATETTVFNFLQGQYASMQKKSFQKAVELYPLNQYNNSFDLQGQQMYGEVRYICTAGLLTGRASEWSKTYQYHYDNPHLGSNHRFELDAFFSPPADANTDDLALFEAMREYWTSFVTTGVPMTKNGSSWKAVNRVSGTPRMLLQPGNIGMETVTQNLENRCTFWRDLSGEIQI